MKRTLLGTLRWLALAVIVSAPGLHAQAPYDPDQVLVENRWAKVTRGDYEAELMRLPPDMRGGFAVNGKRVYDLLNRLLVTKSLAAQARAAGLDKDPSVERRLALEVDRLHAGLQIAKIEDAAGRAFDARRGQFETRAREIYLTRRDAYRVPEQVAVSHILFDTKKRSREEALKLAQETRAKILAGADFSDTAAKLSDDPTAFSMKNPGDVSEPVLSSFGYHIIRLDGRRPAGVKSFDEVKDTIIAQERSRYIDEQRELALAPIKSDPDTKVDQARIDALIVKVDPEKAKKATQAVPPK